MRKSGRLERSDLVPGAVLVSVYNQIRWKDQMHEVRIDPAFLNGRLAGWDFLQVGTRFTVIGPPFTRNTFRLVALMTDDGEFHEMFYCDVLDCCRLIG